MTRLARKVEGMFIDITFAEEREFAPAKEAFRRFTLKVEDTLTAIAFAEAGDFETAASSIDRDGGSPSVRSTRYPARKFTRICVCKG